MNTQTVLILVKYAVYVIGLLLIVFLLSVVTPKIAHFIDKKRGIEPTKENPSGVDENKNSEEYTVKDPYEPQSDKDFDPNYKIYNEDIYGLNLKRKKEKSNTNKNEDKNEGK